MRVLIAGARSALGSRVATLLRADGHDVVSLTRTASAGPGFVVADVLDATAITRIVAQVAPDAVVQTLNALPKAGPRNAGDLAPTFALRTHGTRNLVDAAAAGRVTRFVAENFFLGYGRTPVGSPPVTEEAPFDDPGNPAVVQDGHVLEFGGVSLRCGLFYGPQVGTTENLCRLVRRRRAPLVRGARNKYSNLHIDDAAAAVVAALDRGQPGSAYNVADDVPAGPQDFITELALQLGAPKPLTVPRALVRLGGAYLRDALTSNLVISNDKARRELRWAPAYPSIREGLKTVVDGRISSAV